MKNELLTCIILTFKNKEYLYETIDSVCMQDYPNIELIIAEDASGNFDIDKVREYVNQNKKDNIKKIIIYSNEHNLGTVKNINKAIKKSSGQYFKIIAGDDTYPEKDVFSKEINYLKKVNGLLVVGDTISCDANLKERYRVGFKYCKVDLLNGSRKRLYKYLVLKELGLLATQVCCFHRSFFTKIGYYDESYILLEDMPMEKRIVLSNIKINYFSHPAVNHRGDVGMSTSSAAFDIRKYQYYLDLYNEAKNNYFVDSEVLGFIPAYMRLHLCMYRLKMCKYNEYKEGRLSKIILTLEYALPLIWHVLNHKNSLKVYGKSFFQVFFRESK